MLNLYPVTLNDKDLLNSYIKCVRRENSEFTFTNLLMWQKGYNIRYAIVDDMLVIVPRHGDGPTSAAFPLGTGDARAAAEKLLEYFESIGQSPIIRLYSEDDVQKLHNIFPGRFTVTEDVNSFDYVYKVQDLINLSGKRYHAKKNHINKFNSLYEFEYVRLSPSDKHECQALFDNWCNEKKDSGIDFGESRDAVYTLLDNWKYLDIKVGGIKVGGELVAFSAGEQLNSNTVLIHLEYANTRFQGSFPMINHQFLINEWSDLEFVNREEDMGIEGMRKAKSSYHPVNMVRKYVAKST